MSTETGAPRGRRLVGVIGLLAATFIPAQAASAQYGPSDEPTLEVDVLQPICNNDVPYLSYAVSVSDGSVEPVTITWVHPDDPSQNQVESGLPMSGEVRWPGAEVDGAGNPTDWPGWRLEGDEWVEGDEWDWTRAGVQVIFAVNPEATVTVAYPPSSPSCLTEPPGATTTRTQTDVPPAGQASSTSLALTGAGVGWLAAGGATLLILGVASVVFARKRASGH